MTKNCCKCGGWLVCENPLIRGLFHASSANIDGWHVCIDCMGEHCSTTDCGGCPYGGNPDCQFLEMKESDIAADKAGAR